MHILKDIVAYAAEDGSMFFSEAEAKTHDALIYIGKTIEAHGASEVTNAIARVSASIPNAALALTTIADQLKTVHGLFPSSAAVPPIDSVQAPPAVRAPDAQPKEPRPNLFQKIEASLGLGGQKAQAPQQTQAVDTPKDPPSDGKTTIVQMLASKPETPVANATQPDTPASS